MSGLKDAIDSISGSKKAGLTQARTAESARVPAVTIQQADTDTAVLSLRLVKFAVNTSVFKCVLAIFESTIQVCLIVGIFRWISEHFGRIPAPRACGGEEQGAEGHGPRGRRRPRLQGLGPGRLPPPGDAGGPAFSLVAFFKVYIAPCIQGCFTLCNVCTGVLHSIKCIHLVYLRAFLTTERVL